MRRTAGIALVATGAAILTAATPAPTDAAPKPDLVVAALGDPPLTVVAGGTVRVAESVGNQGARKAGRSSVVHYLSQDARAGKGDLRLAGQRTVGTLAPRKQAKGSAKLRIPAGTKAGAYHVIACADAAGKVAERSERNNCRPSKGRLAVTLPPRPLTVAPVLDTTRAASATIGSEGGSLSATAAGGTTFTLVLPAGAVLSDVAITMTPLSGVTGLPFRRGLVGGVHLAPDGLRFLEPATLTITPPTPVAAGDVAAFAYRGNGEAFHLQRPRATGASITLALAHFSGAGVAQGDASERAGVAAANPPADAADQAEQQAAVPVDQNAMDAAVLSMYATIVGLAQDRYSIDRAVMFYNAWYPTAIGSRAAALWPALHGQITAKLLQFVGQAQAACVSQRALEEAGWILRFGRLSQTLVPPATSVVQAAAQAVSRCVRFELDVTADLANNLDVDRGRMQARVTGLPVTVQSGFTPDLLSGSKAIEVLDYRIDDFDCWVHTWNPQPVSPLRVLSLDLSGLNPGPSGVPLPVQLDSVHVDLGSVDDQVTHTCSDGNSFTSSMGIWNDGAPTVVGDRLLSSWTPTGRGTWTREYTRAPSPNEPSGTMTFALRHAPLP